MLPVLFLSSVLLCLCLNAFGFSQPLNYIHHSTSCFCLNLPAHHEDNFHDVSLKFVVRLFHLFNFIYLLSYFGTSRSSLLLLSIFCFCFCVRGAESTGFYNGDSSRSAAESSSVSQPSWGKCNGGSYSWAQGVSFHHLRHIPLGALYIFILAQIGYFFVSGSSLFASERASRVKKKWPSFHVSCLWRPLRQGAAETIEKVFCNLMCSWWCINKLPPPRTWCLQCAFKYGHRFTVWIICNNKVH